MSEKSERWVAVSEYEGLYEVSDKGRVRSLARVVADNNGKRTRKLSGMVLATKTKKSGHLSVTLSKAGVLRSKHVHRLVAEAFVPGRSGSLEVCHINGLPSCNEASNLRWGSRQSNVDDMIRDGAAYWQKMTHCKSGHEYTPEGTYVNPVTNHRRCRICRRNNETRINNREVV